MLTNPIKVYGRLKPENVNNTARCPQQEDYKIEADSCGSEENCKEKLTFTYRQSGELINNKPESHAFLFSKIFDQSVQQPEIFHVVAKPVVDSVMQGYNGTLFAYGQSGSGKTYTIIGGPKSYDDRGLIPRSIQYVFYNLKESSDIMYKISVSYFEIYNECGYDLLETKVNNLEDLPRIGIFEDARGHFQFQNLRLHPVVSEAEALNLLFLGDTNRETCETPMNPASSRSHCIFTIHVSARDPKSSKVRKSKMNLVDLAGSERVHKSGIGGKILAEAKHINRSLHFLEQVIVGLSDRDRTHIPYRNSLMTTVLKDSLGGNCLTAMLATMSVDRINIGETVSTCRFAQRVALVKNEAFVNEEVDPLIEIAILREHIKTLTTQQVLFTGEEIKEDLTSEEVLLCKELANNMIEEETLPEIPLDLRKIKECFKTLKELVIEGRDQVTLTFHEYRKCNELVQQKDNEIGALKKALEDVKRRTFHGTLRDTAGKLDSQRGDSGSTLSVAKTLMSPKSCAQDQLVTSSEPAWSSQLFSSSTEEEYFEKYLLQRGETKVLDSSESQLKLKTETLQEVVLKVEVCRENLVRLRKILEEKRIHKLVSRKDGSRPTSSTMNIAERIFDEEKSYRSYLDEESKLKQETLNLKHLIDKEKIRLLQEFRNVSKMKTNVDLSTFISFEPESDKSMSGYSSPDIMSLHSCSHHPVSKCSSYETLISNKSDRSSATKRLETIRNDTTQLTKSEQDLHDRFIARRESLNDVKKTDDNTISLEKDRLPNKDKEMFSYFNSSEEGLVTYNHRFGSENHSQNATSVTKNENATEYCDGQQIVLGNVSHRSSGKTSPVKSSHNRWSDPTLSTITLTLPNFPFVAKSENEGKVKASPRRETRSVLRSNHPGSNRHSISPREVKQKSTIVNQGMNSSKSPVRVDHIKKWYDFNEQYKNYSLTQDDYENDSSPQALMCSSLPRKEVKNNKLEFTGLSVVEKDLNPVHVIETHVAEKQTGTVEQRSEPVIAETVRSDEKSPGDDSVMVFNDIQLTGDSEIDEEILAFYRARNVKIVHTST